ncbi:MAG: PIN domain-containing protein, partial [Panacibacter sp.]
TLELITDFLTGYNAEILTIQFNDILGVEKLPYLHKDPFDRMIISQAIERNIPVLSVDSIFDTYTITRIW